MLTERISSARRPVVALACAALLVTGCSGDPETTEPSAPAGSAAPDAGAATSEAGTDASADAAAPQTGGPSSVPELEEIEWADAPRGLTDIEKEFMYAPGPYAGDAYDEDAVIAAVRAMNPSTPQEWERAITSQIQEDYAEDVKAAITFDPSLGDVAAGPTEGAPEPAEEETVGSNHFALVLDASGSMAEASTEGTRMDEAKAALSSFVATIPPSSTVSLRVYGHEGDPGREGKKESCENTEVLYDGPAEEKDFTKTLDKLDANGWTPLAKAIGDAAEDIPEDATDGIVYVVTDGLESCGGDPVKAAKELAGSGIEPVVNVIGFQVGDADQEALKAIADAGGGEYTQVESGQELEDYWDEEYSRMMEAWEDWKRAELDRIEKSGQEKLRDAEDVGQRLLEQSETEGERGLALTEKLAEQEAMDYETKTEVWSSLYERKVDMWGWAYEVKVDNWSAAYDEKVSDWSDVYDKGTSKWSEYYSKKVGN